MGKRRTCAYCKAVKMDYHILVNQGYDWVQVGCELGCKLEKGPDYIHRGSSKDFFVNNLYPAENCPKPKTLKEFVKLYGSKNGI